MALGTLFSKAAAGIGDLLARKPDKKQPRINQKQFRELLMQMREQGGGADVPLPKSRARGFMRGKDEPDLDYAVRKAQGIPGGGRPTGLSEFFALQDRSLTPEEARIKASIIEEQGGEIGPGGTVSKKGIRPPPQSSTGRAYDPVAERKALLENTKAAVTAKRREQAGEQFDDLAKASRAMQPGSVRGMANKYGWGEGKTLTKEEFAKRPEATTRVNRTLTPQGFSQRNTNPEILRDRGQVTIPLREEIGFMENDQAAELAAYKDAQARKALIKPQSKGFASLFSRR